MKKLKLGLVALCFAALVFPFLLRGRADTAFIFTAFDSIIARNDSTKTVPEDTMTFTSGGNLYVYYDHFSNLTTISRVYYNTRTHEIVLYNINKSLIFDLANDQVYERPSGAFYTETAKWRNGNIFLPLDRVAKVFGLSTSYIDSSYSPAPILRIDSQTPSIPDWYYAQQLSALLNNLYTNSTATTVTTTPGVTPPTATEPTDNTPEPDPAKLVYLLFEGAMSELTADMLDALSAPGGRIAAAFFVPPDAILGSAELIRRAYSEGHTIGLLLSGEWDTAEQAVDELKRANTLLKSVLLCRTRLVSIAPGAQQVSEQAIEALVAEGCRLWDSNITPDLSGALTSSQALSALRTSLSRISGTLVVRLDSGELSAAMLPSLLSYISNGNYSLLGITEWDRPINQIDEIR